MLVETGLLWQPGSLQGFIHPIGTRAFHVTCSPAIFALCWLVAVNTQPDRRHKKLPGILPTFHVPTHQVNLSLYVAVLVQAPAREVPLRRQRVRRNFKPATNQQCRRTQETSQTRSSPGEARRALLGSRPLLQVARTQPNLA